MWEDIQVCMLINTKLINIYQTPTMLQTQAQEYFQTSKDHFFIAVLQKTTAQTDHPGKYQPKEGGYFNQRYEV